MGNDDLIAAYLADLDYQVYRQEEGYDPPPISTKESLTVSSKAIVPEGFYVDMPDEAPPLGFDPLAPSFSWQEVYPDNFWNEENIKARKAALGGWPVLTPKRIVIRPVVDPEEKEPDLSPRIVLEFEEGGPALVFNKSRCQMAGAITGTGNPQLWAERLGRIVLSWGDFNKRLQLVFERAPGEVGKNGRRTVDETNQELFG